MIKCILFKHYKLQEKASEFKLGSENYIVHHTLPLNVERHCPATVHTLAVPSLLADAMALPSGENANAVTVVECPV